MLSEMHQTGATVMGVDHFTTLSFATEILGPSVPLQGNINPELLTEAWEVIEQEVKNVIASGQGAPGHIVNLGHGVPKDTDPEILTKIVSLVHELTK
jgi:uroporphyrinogen decarboxylase